MRILSIFLLTAFTMLAAAPPAIAETYKLKRQTGEQAKEKRQSRREQRREEREQRRGGKKEEKIEIKVHRFDADGDGKVTKQEVHAFMAARRDTREIIKQDRKLVIERFKEDRASLRASLDTDGNGKLSPAERDAGREAVEALKADHIEIYAQFPEDKKESKTMKEFWDSYGKEE